MSKVLILGGMLVALSFAGEESIKLKDGEGKALVEANCSVCHSLDYIQMNSPFLDKKGWEATVNKMIKAMGAPIKQEDVPKIVEYLTKYYGKKE
ncbi:cytochrome c [Hydrogenobacter thermophilus]|uniref:c-type cytochrome n=1 Tax=Hydrogenobacter thermophilus TaxID=940 RepID=UPI0030F5B3D4